MRYYIVRIYRESEEPKNAMAGVVEDAAGRQRRFRGTEELLWLLRDGEHTAAYGETAGSHDPLEER